jgi:ABC-2 type transport system ATP-binding protein
MGKTVLVSSHILTELADFCTSIGIIEAGRLIAAGRIEEITARLAGNVVLDITVKGDPLIALGVLAERTDVTRTVCDGRVIRIEYSGEADDVDGLLEYLMGRGVRVLGFTRAEADLEDIFLKLTKGVVA